jgi:hypothetical protein
MTRHQIGRLLLVLVALVAVTACATRINKVLVDPSRYRNQDVTISGNVVESFSVMDRGVYRVQDQSGALWVVSDTGVPRVGARVKVTGTIREGFNAGTLASRLPAGVAAGIVLVAKSHSARE